MKKGLLRMRGRRQPRRGRVFRQRLPAAGALASATLAVSFLLALVPGAVDISGAATGCSGSSLYAAAHEVDSILFEDPDLPRQIQNGRCVQTIFLTAGDAGNSSSYWLGREDGVKASYAQMAGVSNSWTQSDAGISGHPMPLFTLDANPGVTVIFMRLPDGKYTGNGFAAYGYESMQKLWQGSISTMHVVDGTSSYTKSDLISTLTTLMTAFQADQIRT